MLVIVGDLVADLIVLGSARLARGTDNRAEVRLTRGGSAANVAAVAGPRHPVRFIGRVGDDTLGRTLADELASAGVDVRVQRHGRTGSIVILVDDDGERTMITDRGAAAELDTIDPAWFEGATWLHLPLYGFVPDASRAALIEACRVAHERGVPVSIDLSSVTAMGELGAGELARILDAVSPAVVFANADEARMADELGLVLPSTAVVKQGPDPVVILREGARDVVPVEPVDDVVDSTGAGDAFAAGFLVATLEGADVRAAARAGSVLAQDALRRPGAL
jgi:sugar/nucleoside kinase (ribokinase family)